MEKLKESYVTEGKVSFEEAELQGIRYKDVEESMVYIILKRLMDIVCSVMGLLFLCPILLIISIAIKLESKGPVIFKQERVGKNRKPFLMYKFRSMIVNAEELKEKLEAQNEMSGPMFKIKEDPRVTKVGKFIRKTSLDELPQLVNILKGEMSLVGPRPSLPQEVAQFDPWMMRRLDVQPGLTCYWQVAGRNNIGFKEWMEMDVYYANTRDLKTDIKLIFKTVAVLFGDKNAS